jgi:hypothetical protein
VQDRAGGEGRTGRAQRTSGARKGSGGMHESQPQGRQPELRAMVVAAARALALLDASRLQELALSCAALNGQMEQVRPAEEGWHSQLAVEAREAHSDMAVFERVLEATRANLNVMRRLRSMRMGELEYNPPGAGMVSGAEKAESEDGND